MRVNTRLAAGAATIALATMSFGAAYAQQAGGDAAGATAPSGDTATTDATTQTAAPGVAPADELVVTGVRASLRSAQQIKRNSAQVVDSIVAEDIGKLPDVNVSEALQRITGVQIARDNGEGGTVTIRGLPQVQTTLNGHEIFTASGGRVLNPEDVPSELVAGLDVYKTPSADQVEGGLGGLIDVRTRRPFDFSGAEVSGAVRANYGDLINRVTGQGSILLSDRWNTSIGEVGALVSLSYQRRRYREDLSSIGVPETRTDLIAGQSVVSNTGTYDVVPVGDRKRTGADLVLQWRPNADLTFYAEANYSRFVSLQDAYGASVNTRGGAVEGTPTLRSGTNDVQDITYRNVPLSVLGYTYDTHDEIQQYSAGGKWTHGALTLNADASYTKANGDSLFSDVQIDTTIPRFTQHITTSAPSAAVVEGVDLLDPANYRYTVDAYTLTNFTGDEKAFRLDGSYAFENGPIRSVQVGARYADRGANSNQYSDYQVFNGPRVSDVDGIVAPMPYDDYFNKSDSDVPLLRNYLAAIVPLIRADPTGVRGRLGLSPTLPARVLGADFNIDEKTTAAYAMVNYGFTAGLPIDGNIGLRVVHTKENLNAYQTNAATGVLTPLSLDNDYTNWLPSLNMRVHLTDKIQLKLSASKVLTRPDFSQLSPSETVNPAFFSGNAGNPNLQPLKARQLDASLEYYFAPTGSVYVAAFYKKVDGFITNVGVTEDVAGYDQPFTIVRPVNGDNGRIRGFEVGYQQFYDFLPGLLSGLGAQANYTFVDSEAPSSVAGQSTPLQGLSKNSFNLVGIYEKGPISARVAYNWRSSYQERLFVGDSGIGIVPIQRGAYGWLDASVSYNVGNNVTLTLEGSNLLRTKRHSYYGTEFLPNETAIDDRQILAGVRFHF